jgi:hypothetical protein
MKKVSKIGLALLLFFVVSSQTIAAQAPQIVSAKLRKDRQALIINFANLSQVKSLSYTLSYTAQGIPQGVVGTITPKTQTLQRTLLFGTCSKNVCRYHKNIQGMKLVVTAKLKSGKKYIKTFKVYP